MELLAFGRVVPRGAAALRHWLGRAPLGKSGGAAGMSFCLSFHQLLLRPTEAHWPDNLPDVSSKDSTRQHAADDPLLSCNGRVRRASAQRVSRPSPFASHEEVTDHSGHDPRIQLRMTDPAVVAAVAGATGVIAGSLVSSVGVVLRERVVGRREREAQQALRHQQLADQRAAFQRDTILALQDGLGELWALSADAYNRAAATRAKTGEWPPPEQADLPTLNTVSARITALRARVFDDDLRLLVRELQTSLWSAVEASDWSEQEERMVAARDPMNRMQERVHLLLNELF
jgi:hypothetical protein